ncbi:hypothetical protein A9Q99_13165 [Gammaproteobacteria bacterium 45_16_T64]|nr:hypothetical protein A9Q99_13165 [Gammaproteobacteria bacterium 45_16_T64]
MHYLYLLLFLLISNITTASEPDQQVPLVTGEFPPYSSNSLTNGGMITELVEAAFDSQRQATSITFLPWKRGYGETLHHDYFATFPYVKDASREKLFWFSRPIFTSKVRLFTLKKSNLRFEIDSDLQGLTTCVPQGYSTQEIERFIEKKLISVTMTPKNDTACIKALLAGRVDVFSVNEITGWNIINKLYGPSDKFSTIGKSISQNNYYLIASKRYPNGKALIDSFNKGLSYLQKQDTYRSIVAKYLPKP